MKNRGTGFRGDALRQGVQRSLEVMKLVAWHLQWQGKDVTGGKSQRKWKWQLICLRLVRNNCYSSRGSVCLCHQGNCAIADPRLCVSMQVRHRGLGLLWLVPTPAYLLYFMVLFLFSPFSCSVALLRCAVLCMEL